MKATISALTLAALLVVPASGFAQNRTDQQMLAELRMLQEQLQQLRLAVNTLADSVKAVATKQDEQTAANRKSFADQKLLTDGITDSIRILREKGDDTNVRISTLSHEVETLRQTTQAVQTSVAQAAAMMAAAQTAAPATPADPTQPAGTPITQQTPPINIAAVQSSKAVFDHAYGDYAGSQYALAIEGFKDYLRSFPTSPDAYKAQNYIADSYFQMARYREAVQAAREAIENYKNSPWLPDAYFRRGSAYLELQMKEQAKADFEYIIKNFPDHAMAGVAKSKLDGIK